MKSDARLISNPWTVFGLWTVPALLSALETVTFSRLGGHPVAPWRAFVGEAPQWYGWALLTVPIIRLGERFPLRPPVRLSRIGIHATLSVAASFAIGIADAAVNQWIRPTDAPFIRSVMNWFVSGLPVTTLVYFAILGVGYALGNSARLRERERRAAELEAQLRDAQLAALRMQLQPHFLFNSLNAVMALVRDQDTPRAIRALSLLSDVLRTTVSAGDAQQTTLAQEIEFVTRYLEIERVRFGDRLRVSVDVPEGLEQALVPTFVLQPFVENSLKHGVLRERTGNEIAIGARATTDRLVLTVTDDGRGLPVQTETLALGNGGVGIANARARLDQMYGRAADLSVRNGTAGRGVFVEVTLPLQRQTS